MLHQKIWFITGVSAGMGEALAAAVYKTGDKVIGTVRKPADQQRFNEKFPGHGKALLMDLTDIHSIQIAIKKVVEEEGRIDVLVNNAGYGIMGAVEEISDAEARLQMETNFFGLLHVTREVLPIMRQQGHGHIIQVSSRLGIVAGPGFGLYAASKFAVEGLSEALAAEVGPLGIKVTITQPGPVRTQFFGNSGLYAAQEIPAYRAVTGDLRANGEKMHGAQAGDPEKVAAAVIEAVNMENPPLRLPLTPRTNEALLQKINELQEEHRQWSALANSVIY